MNRAQAFQLHLTIVTGVLLTFAGTASASTGACLNPSGQSVSGCSAVDGEFSDFLTPANNDFTSAGVGTSFLLNPSIADQGGTGWVFTSMGNPAGGLGDDIAGIYGSQNYAAPPPTGSQVAGFQQFAGSTYGASISEEVSGFTVGADYAVTFDIAQALSSSGLQAPGVIEVLLGGQLLGTFSPTSDAWTSVTTGMVTATASTMDLEFYAPAPAPGSISAYQVDSLFTDVTIGDPSDVPEPATVVLIGLGFVVVAMLQRRRRSS